MALALTPDNLTFENLEIVSREKPLLELPAAIFAATPAVAPTAEKTELALVFLQTHAVSFGPAVPEEVIRLALVLQFYPIVKNSQNPLAPTVIQRLLAFYNREVFPVVQQQGSPASQATQLYLPLLGQGKVSFQGYELNAADVNDIFSWEPLVLSLPEVNFLVNQTIFTYADTTHKLIKLQPQLQWLNYLLHLFNQIAVSGAVPASLPKLENALTKVKNLVEESVILPVEKQNLGLLRDALLVLLTQINHVTGTLADYTTETLENLFASAEPPATTGFSLASALVLSLQKQLALVAPNPAEVVFTRADIKILNQLLGQATIYLEQLTALAFWTVTQVGKVYSLTPENLILSTYYHSPLFVPKEMVTDQLEKILVFIRNTSPNPVT